MLIVPSAALKPGSSNHHRRSYDGRVGPIAQCLRMLTVETQYFASNTRYWPSGRDRRHDEQVAYLSW